MELLIYPAPHPKQEAFINSPYRYNLFMGGLRSGKTVAGIQRAIKRSIEMPQETGRPGIGWFLVPDYPTFGELLLRRFFEVCPKELIKHYDKRNRRIVLLNNFEIWIKSTDDPRKIQAWGLDWAMLDEGAMMPRLVWDNITARWERGTKGVEVWVTTTIYSHEHPEGYAWIDEIFLNPATRWPDTAVFHAASIDNPSFPREEWERAQRTYDMQFFKERYGGEIVAVEGRVLNSFNLDYMNVENVSLNDLDIYLGIDFGVVDPFAAVWIGRSKTNGRYYLLQSYKAVYKDMEYHADMITKLSMNFKNMSGSVDMNSRIKAIFADPSGGARKERYNFVDLVQMLEKRGLKAPFKQAFNAVYPGLSILNGVIANNRFFVLKQGPGNGEWVKEARGYFWEHVGQKGVQDHLIDATRYVIATLEKTEPFVGGVKKVEKESEIKKWIDGIWARRKSGRKVIEL